MGLGARIRGLRENVNLTQKALAEKLNIPHQNLSNYERGFRQPDYETLKKIADFFEVSTDYLLGHSSDTKTVVQEEKTSYNVTDDPDLQIAFKDASDFSEEARRQAIDFINYLKEKEKAKGRKNINTDND
ncbi:helix-turn-helix domain-containing protein [Bacillus atrophaeus]|uniref:helix-turn-helix domain-containing protein n=1 Tax=Bacillus atrophaeus TaxID=1452 RepID=UPI00123A0168|nr:helix-turn-helix transcriptional regulator [Bacillus atrophaeus]KAA6442351.1 XRE family transcriptional regulator [Bacillus atrophaeus]MCY8973615.1 helix-turn-helix transcriptional regulator [Bacillus atrophaeus]MCY9204401.1 helix-turn-helix transcriptional regulator [Bacillus atrophaeus]MEC0885343.1 helix-turn-helix transcriptional regulator [Bacillus atrophaeus]